MKSVIIKTAGLDNELVVCADSLENSYIACINYLIKNEYTIEGLVVRKRNSNYDTEYQYTVIGDEESIVSKRAEKKKQRVLQNISEYNYNFPVPIIEKINILTDEYIENWSKPFEDEFVRKVYASYIKDGRKRMILFSLHNMSDKGLIDIVTDNPNEIKEITNSYLYVDSDELYGDGDDITE